MKYLLDTDILIDVLRRSPSAALVRRLARTPPEDQATSSVTLGELVYGARRLGGRRASQLGEIERELLAHLPVLPFDSAAAHHYGVIRAELEQERISIGDADTRIAAIALARDLAVVTGNVRHFERVPGLLVENWRG